MIQLILSEGCMIHLIFRKEEIIELILEEGRNDSINHATILKLFGLNTPLHLKIIEDPQSLIYVGYI